MKTDPTKYTTIKWNDNFYSKDAIQYSLISYEKKTKPEQKEKEKLFLH